MPAGRALQYYDAIVLGAGAAGLMCAATAGKRGRRVVVIEHTDQAGAKILISGGGRCNFTNLNVAPHCFLSENPHFCRSALSRYSEADFIALVARHRIAYHEKTLGQLFCDGSARAVVDMLLAECGAGSVDIRLGETVTAVDRADRFAVETSAGRYEAPALVLATGGLSIPKMGASGLSHDIARRFGLAIIEPRPGLVPLRLPPTGTFFDPALAGVSLETVASFDKARFREQMLVTHRGLSGPAILQISSYWRPGEPITLDFAPGANPAALLVDAKRQRPRAMLQTVLADLLPERLARSLVAADLKTVELANIPDRTLNLLRRPPRCHDSDADRQRGLRQGRGHRRRRRYARAVFEDNAGAKGRRPVRHWRGRRCYRLARRL